MKRNIEITFLAVILLIGAWLRFSHLHLLEFKADEAVAAHLAMKFVKGGELPTAGLMSSVGVTNPPLFIYLIIPMFFLTTSIAGVSVMIAVLGLAAVVACWWFVRKYYGAIPALIAAAMFAVSPWAVVYSRKIWAQDFVPVFAVATMWAVHSLCLGGNKKAVFWAVFLPLAVIQIHFSGFALTATVLAILLLLRPKMDWRFAAAGVVAAGILFVPYLQFQQSNGWRDFQQMKAQVGGQKWNLPPNMTIQPDSGYPLPRRPSEAWKHALAIMNGGEIEDVLGLAASAKVDLKTLHQRKHKVTGEYFTSTLTMGDWLLGLQRLAFVGGLVLVGVWAVKRLRKLPAMPWVGVDNGAREWILVLWIVVPLAAYIVAGLWTYLSYYVILYPAHFIILGWVTDRLLATTKEKVLRGMIATAAGAFLLGNIVFMTDLYRFLDKYGGAQGTYGSGLAFKEEAARFLAARADISKLMAEQRLVQMDQWGQAKAPELDLPLLAMMQTGKVSPATDGQVIGPRTVVLVVDNNRSAFDPFRAPPLQEMAQTNFGPIILYFTER
jgi:4-amino-4-deoxy-L-arabinose transferase-like glycosyltransferase